MKSNNNMQEIKKHFQSELKESFNEAKFDEDVQAGKEISLDNLDEYKKKRKKLPDLDSKKPNEHNFSNGHGLSFHGSFKNGQWVGIGSNGHIIKSKNIDDFHRKLAQIFKLNALKNGREPECFLRVGENEPNQQKIMESFARNFINAGVVVNGDLPKSPEFWQTLKTNYLAQKGHDLKTWNRLTRFVPKEYIQTKESLTQYQTKQTIAPKKKTILPAIINKGRNGR